MGRIATKVYKSSVICTKEVSCVDSQELPRVLTVIEIAHYLRISRSAAYELLRHPDFPAIRLGRTVRVSRAAFMQWLEKQENSHSGAK